MRLDAYFTKLLENISLDDTRRKRIETAYAAIKNLLETDEEIKTRYMKIFPQGSYVIGTLARPVWRKEYDIDVVLVLNLRDQSGHLFDPAEVIKWVNNRIKNNGAYKDKAEPKNRCIRINYAGDFRLDVTPVHLENGTLFAPNKGDGAKWTPTNPEGYIAWCRTVNNKTNGKFQKVTLMLKHWRDLNFSKETAPKSIMFTKIIGDFIYSASSSDAECLAFTLKQMNAYFQMQTHIPRIENPALSVENLARDWTKENYELFKSKLSLATKNAEAALSDATEAGSIEKWKKLFQDDFPASIGGIAAPSLGAGLAASFPDKPVRPNKPGGFA